MPTSALPASRAPLPACADPRQPHGHAATNTVTRLAAPDDFDAVNAFHDRCSPATCYARYHGARRSLRLSDFRRLTRPDCGLAWVSHPVTNPRHLIAAMNLVRTTDPTVAELGLMIEDGWQGRGLGTALVRHARASARVLGCRSITIMTSADNTRMLRILRALGTRIPPTTSSTIDITLAAE